MSKADKTTSTIFDFEELLRYCGGNQSIAVKLLAAFYQVHGQYLQEMRASIEARDTEKIRAACHKIRGAASTIRANEVVEVAAMIREKAINNDLAQTDLLYNRLADAFNDFLTVAQSHFPELIHQGNSEAQS